MSWGLGIKHLVVGSEGFYNHSEGFYNYSEQDARTTLYQTRNSCRDVAVLRLQQFEIITLYFDSAGLYNLYFTAYTTKNKM